MKGSRCDNLNKEKIYHFPFVISYLSLVEEPGNPNSSNDKAKITNGK